MSSVPKTFNIQGVQLALQLEPEDLPLIEKAVNEINQAVRNVNQGKDLVLTPNKQTRILLYAILQLIYSRDSTPAAVPPDVEKKLESLLVFCQDTLKRSQSY